MIHKLYDRDAKQRRGVSCDETGIYFGGDCALVTASLIDGRRRYQARPIAEVGQLLSAGLGANLDISRFHAALERAASFMEAKEWGLAKIATVQLGLPELADASVLEQLNKADALLRFNANHRPAGPGGGQFTSEADDSRNSVLSDHDKELSSEARKKLIAVQDVVRKDPRFAATKKGTHCNEAVVETVRQLDGTLDGLIGADGKPLSANTIADNLSGSKKYRLVTEAEAQIIANRGGLAIAAWKNPNPKDHGHVATVRPEGVEGDKPVGNHGSLLNNISHENRVCRRSKAFSDSKKVSYYTPA